MLMHAKQARKAGTSCPKTVEQRRVPHDEVTGSGVVRKNANGHGHWYPGKKQGSQESVHHWTKVLQPFHRSHAQVLQTFPPRHTPHERIATSKQPLQPPPTANQGYRQAFQSKLSPTKRHRNHCRRRRRVWWRWGAFLSYASISPHRPPSETNGVTIHTEYGDEYFAKIYHSDRESLKLFGVDLTQTIRPYWVTLSKSFYFIVVLVLY